jgi:uncharacterized protein (TIGR02001 family)
MRTFLRGFGLGCSASLAALMVATPALADDAAPPSDVTINGSATVVTDYRFRGVSQTDRNPAVQGSITVSHSSGFYASVWGSSVSGYVVATNNTSQEIDLILGWKKTFSGTTLDAGLLYYYYPKTTGGYTNFAEPYVSVAHTFGPVTAKATVNYAPKQKALGSVQNIVPEPSQDNVYAAGDFSAAIPNTPLGLTAHIGHNWGPSWLASDFNGKKGYTDWSVGATLTYKAITFGVQYVDTDAVFISSSGKNVAKGGVVASIGASF